MGEVTTAGRGATAANRRWLREQMNPYFFIAMKDEPGALTILERELGTLRDNRRLILADRERSLVLAVVDRPGTLYDTVQREREREVSYAMFSHSAAPMPGLDRPLEIQRLDFDRRTDEEVRAGMEVSVPAGIRRRVGSELRRAFPGFDLKDFDRLLRILWLNNESYVRISTPERVARILLLLQRGERHGGLYFGVERTQVPGELRILFAVGNPPTRDFLLQVMEVFNRLGVGVNRAYCLTVSDGTHPWFLGTFYAWSADCDRLAPESGLCQRLGQELSATQLLRTASPTYRRFVVTGVMSGEDAALVDAFIAFCHTNLAHARPERYGLEEVQNAFHAHPEIALQLAALFRIRFEPGMADREACYGTAIADALFSVNEYNTGHRHLDELRKTIFRCCLTFIIHTLKTNFFVLEKQALAFRLDPAYLADLGNEVTGDLPPAVPYRVTFFCSGDGFGYHIGFSDIARGGWRTVIARTPDDLTSSATTLFRECFVLAHTQHLKNKDIYEGGSKLVTVLDATDRRRGGGEGHEGRLYKLQHAVASAFLDIFVTDGGRARHPSVVDYYGEDEPIELGPDENMHDAMIEAIAVLSVRRGYLLGSGIISSKRVGINHKEYGVTSTGVVKFAEITMAELGIDMRTDPFRVKFTGGPNGDVAGNALRLVLERCPRAQIVLVLDGTAAVADPGGMDRQELARIVLKEDLHAFDPARLGPGGVMLFRVGSRREGLRELYRKVVRTADGLSEQWISVDEFSREYGDLVYTVPADLFIPGGGRPETIDKDTWRQFLLPDGTPSAQAIVEGANSFITPEARVQLQKKGVIVMRDASANKCGVISSSYEIIANLLLSDAEFLADKERYVAGVLEILERRAGDEARLILRRHREPGAGLYTEISDALSGEINAHYAHLFRYFQERPQLADDPLFRRAILNHLPRLLRDEPKYRRRIVKFPPKYRSAILAAEIASSLVYQGDAEAGFEESIRGHLRRYLPPAPGR